MQRRRDPGRVQGEDTGNDASITSEPPAIGDASATPQLRKPRHGGWKGTEPGREAQMLRGEPGHHLGIFRIGYGVLLVSRTLAFMSSGAVDASFMVGDRSPRSPGGPPAPAGVLNFGHGFLLLGGELGSPTADAVRTVCWCLCAAGAAISVGFRPNAVAFAASLMQFYLLMLEKSLYTDEAYLFALVALLLSFTDCGKTLGLASQGPEEGDGDSASVAVATSRREQPPDTVPHWHVVLLRFQVSILHIHRGLAKAATSDWLLGGQPLLHTLETMAPRHWIRRAVDWALLNEIPGLGGGDIQALAVRANGSLVFLDLFLGVSLLAAPHYRPAAVVLQTAIHLGSAVLGGADARAWHLLIAVTGVLFADSNTLHDTIERVQEWLQPAVSYDTAGFSSHGARRGNRGRRGRRPSTGDSSLRPNGSERHGSSVTSSDRPGDQQVPSGGAAAESETQRVRPRKKRPLQPKPSAATVALLSTYVLAQVLLPLRHLLGMFSVEWSREGHEFAWRAGGGVGGQGGSGGLVREEGLVRVTHRAKRGGRGATAEAQTVHLYGAPLTAQQVFRMVLDPDMLLQLAKRSAETSSAAGGSRGGRARQAPHSTVDAWKSINGRPFARWTDPTVDVWDARFEGEGPSNAEWLALPPLEAELDRAAGMMEAVQAKWAVRGQGVTFFAARAGQTGLSNVFLGGYDPSNFNTTELCAVPEPPASAMSGGTAGPSSAEGGGVLIGVAMGDVELLTDPEQGGSEPDIRELKVGTGTVLAPKGQAHSIRARPSSANMGSRPGGLSIWYYVHACPNGLFHLCIGFLSGAGWGQLYPSHLGTRKGWTMLEGVPKQ